MRIHPGINEVKSYVIKYVRENGPNRIETRLDDVNAYYTQSKQNKHWLLEFNFDDMRLIYDMEDKMLVSPVRDDFYMESFSINKSAHRRFEFTGTFRLTNELGETIKEYAFFGENDCWLPEGVAYLPKQ